MDLWEIRKNQLELTQLSADCRTFPPLRNVYTRSEGAHYLNISPENADILIMCHGKQSNKKKLL